MTWPVSSSPVFPVRPADPFAAALIPVVLAVLSLCVAAPIRGQEEGDEGPARPTPIVQIEKPRVVVVPDEWLEGDRLERRRLTDLESHRRPPELEAEDWINSPPLNLGMLQGKVVVLFFFSMESDPSRAILPHLAAVHRRWKERGVEIVGICASDGTRGLKEAITRSEVAFPVAVDGKGATAADYQVNGRPDFYLIDQEGFLYVVDAQNGAVETIIEKLLKVTNGY
jgi:peroxiredoxin